MAAIDIREKVKERYGKIAEEKRPAASCCGGGAPSSADAISQAVGYGKAEMESVPDGANLGLGCGNPVALAALREGDTVLDLGSGAGFDCFLAAKRVGDKGRVIGVDMTPAMLAKARENAQRGGYTNVEFREGHIEALPVEDKSIDVIISNCVINLSPDKAKVFAEMNRVLKPGGRFFISDLVLLQELPAALKSLDEVYCACIGGASLKKDYFAAMAAAGLRDVRITKETHYPSALFEADERVRELVKKTPGLTQDHLKRASESVVSVQVEGRKGATGGGCCGGNC
jgi:SAM-dependent methyltransferase